MECGTGPGGSKGQEKIWGEKDIKKIANNIDSQPGKLKTSSPHLRQ